jgi:MFS family permease
VLVTGVLMLLNITYGMVMNPSLSELAEAVDRRWIGAYGAVYALYNVGYSVGQMGGNLLAGQLTLSVSFLGALMTMSALLLVSVPAIAYLRRPAATSRHELYPMRGSD